MKKLIVCLASLIGALPLLATDGVWTSNVGGSWSDEANWSGGTKPSAGAMTFSVSPTWVNGSVIELDEDASFASYANAGAGGAGVYLESSPKMDGSADRYGVAISGSDFSVANSYLSKFGVTFSGSGSFTVAGGAYFAFTAPQSFTGPLIQNSGTGVIDYRAAAVSSADREGSLLATRSAFVNNGQWLRVYGRNPSEEVSLWCRITPGSPDLVMLATNFTAQSKVPAGVLVSAEGIPAGAFVTRVRETAANRDTVISIDRVPDASVTEPVVRLVTFAASRPWDIRQSFDSLRDSTSATRLSSAVHLQMTAGLGSSVAFDIGSIDSMIGPLDLHAPTEIGGWDGRCYLKGASIYNHEITVSERTLLALGDNTEAPTAADLAADPALGDPAVWMDASAEGTVTADDSGVSSWHDVRSGDAYVTASCFGDINGTPFVKPSLMRNAIGERSVVDFGPAGSMQTLQWDREVTGIKAVFLVLGSQNGGGTLLGNRQSSTSVKEDGFHRGFCNIRGYSNGTSGAYQILRDTGLMTFPEDTSSSGYNAVNGNPVQISESGCPGGYDLYAFSNPARSLCASAFGGDQLYSGLYPGNVGMTENNKKLTGGQRLAEVLVYTNSLTKAQCKAVEAYLAKKWLDRDMPGYGGARVNNVNIGGTADANMARFGHAEETGAVTIDKLTAPAGYGFEVKAGSDLTVNTCPTGAIVRLNAGSTLRFGMVPITEPSMDRCVLRIDASQADCIATDDGGTVTAVRNAVPGAMTPWLYPADYAGAVRPTRVQDEAGRWVLDFGERDNGCCLRCFTNFVARSVFLVSMERTNGTQELGSLKNGYADSAHPSSASYRSLDNYDFWRNGYSALIGSHCGINAKNGIWYYDGVRCFDTPNTVYNTGKLRMASGLMEGWGGVISAIGGRAFDNTESTKAWTGGFQLAEMIIYDRRLTETERRAVEAYLMKKWFKTDAVGAYEDVLKLASVELTGDATLEAPAGTTVSIGRLTGTGTLTAAGDTKIIVTGAADAGAVVADGAVVRPTAEPAAASGAILHADAATTEGMQKYTQGSWDGNNLANWTEKAQGLNLRTAWSETDAAWYPYVRAFDATKYYIDLGDLGSKRGIKWWNNRFTNIRTVFWMWRDTPTKGGGWLLGDSEGTNAAPGDFARGNLGDSNAASPYFHTTYASEHVRNGDLRRDGIRVNPTVDVPGTDWQVLSLVTTGDCAADQIAADRTTSVQQHWGGLQFGELIIYDRALGEVERVATEEYLMSKWLGRHNGAIHSDGCAGYVMGGTTVSAGESGAAMLAGFRGADDIVIGSGKVTAANNDLGFSGKVTLTGGSTLVLADGDYADATFVVEAGSALDLGGRTVHVKSIYGGGTVVNGKLVADEIPEAIKSRTPIYLTVEGEFAVGGVDYPAGHRFLCSYCKGLILMVR